MRFTSFGKALFFACLVVGCSKDDPAPPIYCYAQTITEVVDSVTYTEVYFFNSDNKVVKRISSDSATSREASYEYDAKGNLMTMNSSTGAKAEYTHNANNQLTLEKYMDADNIVTRTTFTYTATGQLSRFIVSTPGLLFTGIYAYPNTTTRNPEKLTFSGNYVGVNHFVYDDKVNPYKHLVFSSQAADNNIIKASFGIKAEPSVHTYFTYEYNDRGYPIKRTSSDGAVTSVVYECK